MQGPKGRANDDAIDDSVDVRGGHRRSGRGLRHGEDPRSETNATQVTWTDGKPAIAISCREPGSCQTRAVAMCNRTGGGFTTLKMENMPTRGDMTVVRGAASVVIRCGA